LLKWPVNQTLSFIRPPECNGLFCQLANNAESIETASWSGWLRPATGVTAKQEREYLIADPYFVTGFETHPSEYSGIIDEDPVATAQILHEGLLRGDFETHVLPRNEWIIRPQLTVITAPE
jgi:hypothetical protein